MINWTVRFRNKVWVTGFVTFVISTVYQFLAMFEVIPPVAQTTVMEIAATALQLLSLLGVIVDPTTQGLGDSERALNYTEPN